MEHSDRELVCASCGQRFLFTGGEQSYFAQNGLQPPRRCKACRAQRKSEGGAPRERTGDRGNDRGNERGGERRGGGNFRGPQRSGFKPAAADDPNGYRAPGFQADTQPQYRVDYAGLPRDEEDDGGVQPGRAHDDVDRFGMRTDSSVRAPRAGYGSSNGNSRFGAGLPRGMNGRRQDRSGTDPLAYRSPAFAGSAPAAPRRAHGNGQGPGHGAGAQGAGAGKRAQRGRHEAQCADCGVQAFVPFQPGPDRPAYCKPCYQARKANGTAPVPPKAGARPHDNEEHGDSLAPAPIDGAAE